MRAVSILDLAPIARGETATQSVAASVALAQRAEELGYRAVWYAEHHNSPDIASSAPAVLIAHVGAKTSSILLGAGGIMLPNHSPLTIAEQFGLLASMYPGRIELGLGRAPGTDHPAMLAMRRDLRASEAFPRDVVELQAYLTGESRVPGVESVPQSDTSVPLYILGSSLFGAQLAAALGLPYAFASHFAPTDLRRAIELYKSEFKPSEQLDRPYAMAGINVLVANTTADAQAQLLSVRRARAVRRYGRQLGIVAGPDVTDEDADRVLAAGAAAHVDQVFTYTALGTPKEVETYLADFVKEIGVDELVTVHRGTTLEERLLSITLLAEILDR